MMSKIEITYTMQGDYQLPNLTVPKTPEVTLGYYARMRKKYLKEYREGYYITLLTTCKLTEHLAEVEERAMNMEDNLVREMAKREGLSEHMKSTDMMEWVRQMNNIRNRAMEIVKAEVIYV